MSDLMQNEIIKAYIQFNAFGELLGMDFHIEEKGFVRYELNIYKQHLATHKAAHGGVVAALLDACLGVAALSWVCEDKRVVSTVNLNLTFMAPVLEKDILIAKAKVVKGGQRIIFAEGEVWNQSNVLVAKANGVFNAYPMEKAGY
jgi:uncharacterized protein (TIGR00369 family)